MEDALETPRRRGTSKVARDFKIDTELSSDMHTAFLTCNTPLNIVRNKYVLLDSLEDALETPRRQGTSKEARDFKIDTELSGDMHTAFLS